MVISPSLHQNEKDKFGGDSRAETYVRTSNFNQLVTEPFDYVDCSYTAGELTGIVYKTGGVSGDVVATITITYTNGCIDTISKA